MPKSGVALLLVGLLGSVLGGCMQATLSPTSSASLSPRDRQLLAHPPYARADIPETYRRHIVDYTRKEQPGTILVDMSTISPLVSQKIYQEAKKKGVKALDAPVSGGEKGAIEGILSIMVGGDQEVFEAVRPVLQAMGKTITYMGSAGAGGFTKLANQVIVAINLTAIGEALTLAAKAGLDPERLIQALGGGMAGSRCLEMKGPQIIKGNFQPGFKIDLHYKDLGLIMEAARSLQVPLPTTAIVQELFAALRSKGRGGLDHSAIITLIEDLANIQVRVAR